MSFLGSTSLKQLIASLNVVTPYDENKIKNGAYELTLGSQVFQTGTKPRTVKNLSSKEKIYIEPGQFALLLTEQVVKIPKDKIAFISIKASSKFNGLVNVSGFHVDPGFEGKLLFSVYNAGPSTIIMSQGTSYFPIWFCDLNEEQEYQGKHGGQTEIPDEPVKALCQGELASPNELSKRIDDLRHLTTKVEWIFLTLLGLVIALSVKLWTDNYNLRSAVEFGYKKKTDEILFDSVYNKSHMDFAKLNYKIDSLTKLVETKPKATAQ